MSCAVFPGVVAWALASASKFNFPLLSGAVLLPYLPLVGFGRKTCSMLWARALCAAASKLGWRTAESICTYLTYLAVLLINYLLYSCYMQTKPYQFIFHQHSLCYFSAQGWHRSPDSQFKPVRPYSKCSQPCCRACPCWCCFLEYKEGVLHVFLLQKVEPSSFLVHWLGISITSLLQSGRVTRLGESRTRDLTILAASARQDWKQHLSKRILCRSKKGWGCSEDISLVVALSHQSKPP